MTKKVLSTIFLTSILTSNIAHAAPSTVPSNMQMVPADYFDNPNTIARTDTITSETTFLEGKNEGRVFIRLFGTNGSLFGISEKYSIKATTLKPREDANQQPTYGTYNATVEVKAPKDMGIVDNLLGGNSQFGLGVSYGVTDMLCVGAEIRYESIAAMLSDNAVYNEAKILTNRKKTNIGAAATIEAIMDFDSSAYVSLLVKLGAEFNRKTTFSYDAVEVKDNTAKPVNLKNYESREALLAEKEDLAFFAGVYITGGYSFTENFSLEIRGGADFKFGQEKETDVKATGPQTKIEITGKTTKELSAITPFIGIAGRFSF